MATINKKLDYLTYELSPYCQVELPAEVRPCKRQKAIHFVGLGGIGMSGIAKIFAELNYKISGSDIKDSPTLFSMSERGATVFVGHNENNIENAGVVVVSSAIKRDNPEVRNALNKNIPIVHRSQMLSYLTSGKAQGQARDQVSIGVTGTHGKTTTSGMVGWLFDHSSQKPTIIVGGQMPSLNTNSKLGDGRYFIAELDESDGTIVLYKPDITIITNLELDHSDHYEGGMAQVLDTFEIYINNLPDDATVILNIDSEGNRQLLERLPAKNSKILTYSIEEGSEHYQKAKFKATDIQTNGFRSSFKVLYDNEPFGDISIIIPGLHNISNALAAIAVGIESGLGLEKVVSSICKFTGMRRRFQVIGEANGAQIVDDYAHHPTEVSATLSAARHIIEQKGKGRVIAIFQPHRYTRFTQFFNDFLNSFDDADAVYVCDVYGASESPIEGISPQNFAETINHKAAQYAGGKLEAIAQKIYKNIQPDDLVITLGAGDITKLGNILIEKIERG